MCLRVWLARADCERSGDGLFTSCTGGGGWVLLSSASQALRGRRLKCTFLSRLQRACARGKVHVTDGFTFRQPLLPSAVLFDPDPRWETAAEFVNVCDTRLCVVKCVALVEFPTPTLACVFLFSRSIKRKEFSDRSGWRFHCRRCSNGSAGGR